MPALELYSCYRMRLLTAFLAPLSGGLESTAAAAATTAQTSSNISQISKDFTLQQPASSEWLATDKQLIMSSFPTNILADVGALESGDDRPVISGVGDGPELS